MPEPITHTAASSCCPTDTQTTCCKPEQKSACCGKATQSSCGCSTVAPSADIRQPVR
jgi:hypothetical protein